jgi:chromosome segregation ATPase
VEFSDDAYGRLAKARIAALRDELSAQARELRDARARLRDRESELKATLTEKAAVAKQLRGATSALEKERRAVSDLRAEADAKAREAAEARRDADRSTVRTKASEAETKARDVRLNRALEEVERYKSALAEARDETKGGGAESRREATELRGDVRRLERQKQELTAAFKKQSRLVDVLRKQKTHLEAARVVQFAEEAFLNVLEKGESHKGR